MELPEGFETQIDFESVLFQSAFRGLQDATTLLATLEAREGDLRWLDLHGLYLSWDLGDEVDEVPGDSVQRATEQAEEALERLLEGLVAAHVFGVMTLEAHINGRAQVLLSGAMREGFDALALAGKWLMLPKLAGKDTFDPGSQPYQGFKALVATRNALVHPRRGAERRLLPRDAPPLEAAASGIRATRDVIDTVRTMATHLADLMGDGPPAWVAHDGATFFPLTRNAAPANHRAAEREMWGLMTTSDAVAHMTDVGLVARPHDVLRHSTFRDCVEALGGAWYQTRAGRWQLVGPQRVASHGPVLTADVELTTGEPLSDWRRDTGDPVTDDYTKIRESLLEVLASHQLGADEFLRF